MYNAAEYAQGLRDLADWVEAHPEIDLPDESISVFSKHTKEEAAKVLLALTPCKKDYSGDLFTLSRSFGHVRLKFLFVRSAVCTRRVVRTEEVPEEIIPEKVEPEQVIAAHTKEIVEWDCDPILAETKEPA